MKHFIKGTLVLFFTVACSYAQAFTHPGIFHNRADLDRLKNNVNIEPYKSAYTAFKATKWAQSSYVAHPVTDETYNVGQFQIRDDSRAAYYNAVMWYVTGNTAYRDTAKTIINGWVTTMQTFDVTDHLTAGPAAMYFSNAGEILRYENGGWTATDITMTENWLVNKLLPPLLTPGGSIAADTLEAGNHGSTQIYGLIAMGIFCNRTDIYNFAVNSYNKNSGGTTYGVLQYIHSSGQNYESYRDQGHATGGGCNYAYIAEMAYKQGTDLYATGSNRLLTGSEHLATYNMMWDVAPVTWTAQDGLVRNSVTSLSRKPSDNAGFILAYNHYKNRQGLSMDKTQLVVNFYYPYTSTGEYFLYMTDSSGVKPTKPVQFGQPAPTDAVLFGDGSYGGNFLAHFGVGSFNNAALLAAGAFNNGASSLKVPRGWRVTVYDGNTFDGASAVLTGNEDFLGDVSLNDKVSSLKVESTGGSANIGVTFYSNTNFTGTSVNRNGSSYYNMANMGIANDVISSMRIPAGYIVILWDADNFTGSPLGVYQADVADLGSSVADKTSSFLVIKNF